MVMIVTANIIVVSFIVMILEWLLLKIRKPKERFILSMAIIAFLVSIIMIDYTMGFILAVLDK